MKANPRKFGLSALALLATGALVASCQQPRVIPTPTPSPTPPPAVPRPQPTPDVDWRQAEITPGDWEWSMTGGQSVARFAQGQFMLRCDPRNRSVTLLRAGTAAGEVPITIRTSQLTRQVMGTTQAGAIAVTLPARDPLLDAMAFSRGRFAVETRGLPTLYVPSWPEVSRVIEDCR